MSGKVVFLVTFSLRRIPYRPVESATPVEHAAFRYFFVPVTGDAHSATGWIATKRLKYWEDRQRQAITTSAVYEEDTLMSNNGDPDLRITVIPFYAGARHVGGTVTYYWNYQLRLRLLGDVTQAATLRRARITVYASNGHAIKSDMRLVEGGREPRLTPNRRAFQSMTSIDLEVPLRRFSHDLKLLQVPRGQAWGAISMQRDDGVEYTAAVPVFHLEAISN